MKSDDFLPKICVIGAGPSGLAVAKNLLQRSIPFDCFERESDVGGNWNYGKNSSSLYASTHMISSKRMTEFTDFPMPHDFPPYPSHQQALTYLCAYARHFDLYERIQFVTSVTRVEREGPHWRVTLDDHSPPRRYAGVVVANGHHWDPFLPQFEGTFSGQSLHARQYKTPEILSGKRVLVVGAGNSGCDIAVEAAQHASKTFHSFRRGYYFLPKFLFGRPIDSGGERLHRWGVPLWLSRKITSLLTRIALGRPETYGFPKPDHQLFETHPIINSQLPYFVGHGRLRIKPNIQRFEGQRVHFTDGTHEEIDLIIYATGYRISFPFLDESLICDAKGHPRLFLNTFHPEYNNLFIAGLIQPNSGIWRLADYQGQLIASFLQAQKENSPTAAWFEKLKKENRTSVRGGIQFINTPRHVLEVDYFAYREQLKRLIRRFANST